MAETHTVDGVAAGDVILEVRDLAKVFPVRRGVVLRRTVGTVQAVDGVSLTLRRGHTVGLVGESGSGKTTLARMLVGVERPTGGQVLVDGVDVTTMSRTARRARFAAGSRWCSRIPTHRSTRA